eukprot:m.16049 g.16049  ORF g.16049 m.16049 type:complete len:117 (-) comp3471_c0_seq1:1505-1855(-)
MMTAILTTRWHLKIKVCTIGSALRPVESARSIFFSVAVPLFSWRTVLVGSSPFFSVFFFFHLRSEQFASMMLSSPPSFPLFRARARFPDSCRKPHCHPLLLLLTTLLFAKLNSATV